MDTIKQAKEHLEQAQELSFLLRKMLSGVPQAVQSAALADITSVWLAHEKPEVRDAVWQAWKECVERLIPMSVGEFWSGEEAASNPQH